MKTFEYRTDGESGEVTARNLSDALRKARRESGVTAAAIKDGAWCKVYDPETDESLSTGN